jgi:hypothetical protein
MSKITKVEEIKSTYQGKEKKSYKFTLDDGKVGYASNKAPWEFKEGDAISYSTEVKKSSKGEYNLFTFTRLSETIDHLHDDSGKGSINNQPLPPLKPQIHVGTPKSIQELKTEAAISCTRFMVDAFIADKAEWAEIAEKQKVLYALVSGEIDDCFKN